MDSDSRLIAIQSLVGKTRNEKRKYLSTVVDEIIKNPEECKRLINKGETDRVLRGLVPLLKILVGERIKSNEAVVEALKSNEGIVVKHALHSKFFFHASNPLFNPDFFLSDIIPFISMRTRRALIKTLGRRLSKNPSLADDFFIKFAAVLPNINQLFPIVISCSEKKIEENVKVLPYRFIVILYRKHPQMFIKYFASLKCRTDLNTNVLICMLLKKYTKEFMELRKKYGKNSTLKSTRAKLYLKNATDMIIKTRQYYQLRCVPLKLLTYKLMKINQFENWFKNVMISPNSGKKIKPDTLPNGFNNLKYYPQEKKLSLLQSTYDFRECTSIMHVRELWKLILDNDLKKELGNKIISQFTEKYDIECHLHFLPPEKSIPQLKKCISISTIRDRSEYLEQMIESCDIYNDKDMLLNVLKYYNEKHKNELPVVLKSVLEKTPFDLVDYKHLNEIITMVYRAYLKDEIFKGQRCFSYECIFSKLLPRFFPKNFVGFLNEEDEKNFEKLVQIIIDGFLKYNNGCHFGRYCAELPKQCTLKFLRITEDKYDKDHKVWTLSNAFDMYYELLQAVHGYIKKNFPDSSPDSDEKKNLLWNLGDKNLSQLKSLTFYALKFTALDTKLSKLVKEHDPILYQDLLAFKYRAPSGRYALDLSDLIKRDYHDVQDRCLSYLIFCRETVMKKREQILTVKNFVAWIKWYDDIPIKFAEKCLEEIKEDGSLLVLGMLLEGKKFNEIVKSFTPDENFLKLYDDNAQKSYDLIKSLIKAMLFTNPPVDVDLILPFCYGDYITITRDVISSVAERTPLNVLLELMDKLENKPVSTRKIGFHLIIKPATKRQLYEFVCKRLEKEKNPGVRRSLLKSIFYLFIHSPNEENWVLLDTFISSLQIEDEYCLSFLCDNADEIHSNYLTKFFEKYKLKINSLDMSQSQKCDRIVDTIDNFDVDFMTVFPENLIEWVVIWSVDNKLTYFQSRILPRYLSPKNKNFDRRLDKLIEILEPKVKILSCLDNECSKITEKSELSGIIERVISNLIKPENDAGTKIIQRISELLFKYITPIDLPFIYIRLQFYNEAFKIKCSKSAYEKGIICGKKLEEIIREISSEFIKEIAKVIDSVLCNYYSSEKIEGLFNVIQGLMKSDEVYGSLVGIYLLKIKSKYNFNKTDQLRTIRENFINDWSKSNNLSIKAALSLYLQSTTL